ncbi:hybrid sensor histidine kinase/response regulator [Roseateles sp. BYS87W]|uniref:histidine kinase n=1 Tax=Pelomonas baiyunensis TaxID=3299026 RepID=A0ABW7H3N6_9BURK
MRHPSSLVEPADAGSHDATRVFAGQSPGAQMLRQHDWAASSLGPTEHWPPALRAAATLLASSPVPKWLAWGPELTLIYNPAYAELLGAKHPQALGASLREVWAEAWPVMGDLVAAALAGEGVYREHFPFEMERHGRREPAWFTFWFTPLHNEDGAVCGLMATVWDTTAQVQAQQELRDQRAALRLSEQQFQALFDRIDEGFCIIEFLDGPHGPMSDYVHVMANPAYLANAGIANVVGQKVRDMVPDEADAWVDIYRRVLLTGEPVRFERELVKTARYLELAAFRIEPPSLRRVAVLFQDVTSRHRAEIQLRELNDTLERRVQAEVADRMRIEDALRQAQKMEAVGQLTGGIAHDFNNLLAVVLSSLDLLGRKFVGEDPQAMRFVDAARNGARRAAQLTQRLLAFARQQPLQPEPVEVNQLVAGMADLLRHALGTGVALHTDLAEGLWCTHVDRNQLENAVLNLAVNARDAMAGEGAGGSAAAGVDAWLRIQTANVDLQPREPGSPPGLAPGPYVRVSVADNGSGMPPEVVARAFEPFFTTKEVGRGTGLGLSQVYGFVKQSGGDACIESRPGQGTVVHLFMPRRDPAPADANPVAADGSAPVPQGRMRELILVVEDEPEMRALSVETLQELGYRVLQADSGPAALRLLDAHPTVDLLFTDVVMPGMHGRQLVDEARHQRPALRVLYTTGFTRHAVEHNGVLEPGVHLIAKPFTLEDLAARVREVLDA